MLEAYIYDGLRSPFTRQDGALSRVRPDDMLGDVIKAMVTRTGFAPETIENVEINLGVATDLNVGVKPISVTETVTVTAQSDTVFSSGRTGAATSVNRETLASMPTVRGLISDFTRLTPQTSGSNSFGGGDSRMNNMTVNGAAFNNSFGLGGQPGERTGTA